MFQPSIFRETDTSNMHMLMRSHPFATLVTASDGVLSADHLPLVLHSEDSGRSVLHGHLSAGNPLCRAGGSGSEVLGVFHGPQSYITPSWYASKAEHGRVVPTWNYVSVHVRGALRLTRDPKWLLRHLEDLTAQHESEREKPWSVADAPDDFVERQFRGLVGLEITISDLQGVWKVSQNKTSVDQSGVAAGLRSEGGAEEVAISELVEAHGRS
ncbi:FMN-binding negative transcriptional regulator [Jannaschia sp. CCS1]|uniref:FMN-binding negative transcriptional regulator n=1 Tax=Jannaschia sp. (strain CCS1) TaxID=290400 RepID=UPI000316B2E4|nr:FMN-binding negative transcriptional regulator [Jannaschia sp. CCS1]